MCEACEKSYKPNPMSIELSHTHHIAHTLVNDRHSISYYMLARLVRA